ncbi:MAG TPA: zf-HC2 domain-containing protein [Candidatus Bathyarchaeia archaeon]|nr:zf-HC2 domain-containing protein [Candidatus Bathyarchaeia archaeon]
MTFLERVLAATSGPACPSAENRFVSFVDGELDPVDRELVTAHVAGCRPCREELVQVRALLAELPRIAEVVPDRAFVGDVLRRTAASPRWAETWRRLMLRPRFALELAYVGAVVLCVVATYTDFHVAEVRGKVKTMISELKEKP